MSTTEIFTIDKQQSPLFTAVVGVLSRKQFYKRHHTAALSKKMDKIMSDTIVESSLFRSMILVAYYHESHL